MQIKDFLTEIVSINSVFPNEKNLAEYLYNQLIDLGFTVQKQYISEDRFNVLAEKGEGPISYLLYAHTDTVPIYGNWLDDPLKLRLEGDKAIGLGAADMKSGISAIIKAIKDFRPQNYKLKIAFGVDEENYSEGAYKLSLTDWLDDVIGVLVPESSLPASASDNAGNTISIGRKGRAVYLIKIYGKSAHGVELDKGINAINESAKLILALESFEKTKSEMGQNSYFVRRVESASYSLSVPSYAEIELDCHLVNPDNSDLLQNKLNRFIKGLYDKKVLIKGDKEFEIEKVKRPTPFLEPFIVDKDSIFLKVATEAVKEVYGRYEYNYGKSVADENVFGFMNIPTLTIGPLADNHHSAEEWVSLDSIEKLAEIYRKVLEKLENI